MEQNIKFYSLKPSDQALLTPGLRAPKDAVHLTVHS